jgi:hypothetical protein
MKKPRQKQLEPAWTDRKWEDVTSIIHLCDQTQHDICVREQICDLVVSELTTERRAKAAFRRCRQIPLIAKEPK